MQETQSRAELIASLNEDNRKEFMDSLSNEEAIRILYDWKFWARKNQLEPATLWQIWLLLAGRGFGKTRAGAEVTNDKAAKGTVKRIALVGQTVADVRDTMIEGDSGILSISPPWFMPEYIPSRRLVRWPNGVRAFTYSSEKPRQLRGPQHGFAWCDELASWEHAQETWDMLMFGLRKAPGQVVVTTTPKPLKVLREIIKDQNTYLTTGTTYDNLANLSDNYKNLISKYEGTRLGRQELLGALLEDIEGALWSHSLIDDNRQTLEDVRGDLSRVVVSIDPAVTSNPNSNETGIIVCGKRKELAPDGKRYEHFYPLADYSCRESPNAWAQRALNAYDEFIADAIVVEVNQGGQLVANTLRTVRGRNRPIRIREVRASKGKWTRAEPVAALYEQKRAHHPKNNVLDVLEDQMCLFVAGEDNEEDDRVDALVWGATDLMLSKSGALVGSNPV